MAGRMEEAPESLWKENGAHVVGRLSLAKPVALFIADEEREIPALPIEHLRKVLEQSILIGALHALHPQLVTTLREGLFTHAAFMEPEAIKRERALAGLLSSAEKRQRTRKSDFRRASRLISLAQDVARTYSSPISISNREIPAFGGNVSTQSRVAVATALQLLRESMEFGFNRAKIIFRTKRS